MEATFGCGHQLIVPDLLYQKELEEYNGDYLRGLGLVVTELTSDELGLAQEIKAIRSGLSLEDCFALVCAERPDHILLAGDRLLRQEAAARDVVCKGILWFLDEMLATGRTTKAVLCEGLTRISQHPRCRLPKAEVEKRRRNWCGD